MTVCLEGRRLRYRCSLDLHRPNRGFHTVHLKCERARQKMSRAFFTPLGKTCHVFWPGISAKAVARFRGQDVTVFYGDNYTQSLREGQAVVENTFLSYLDEGNGAIATPIALKIPYESVLYERHGFAIHRLSKRDLSSL